MAKCEGTGKVAPENEGGTGFAGQMMGRVEVQCPVCHHVYYDWDDSIGDVYARVIDGIHYGMVPQHNVKEGN